LLQYLTYLWILAAVHKLAVVRNRPATGPSAVSSGPNGVAEWWPESKDQQGGYPMAKVKTFASSLKIFHARKELEGLDDLVNMFLEENKVQKVISVSDTCTTGEGGTMGLIRVLAYE
jgi:hypothetical protein